MQESGSAPVAGAPGGEAPRDRVDDAVAGGEGRVDAAPAPDAESRTSPYAIYLLVLLTFANVLSYADRYLFSIAMPAIKAEFGASDSVLGLIGGPAFTISFILFSIPLARLADRWSRRKVLSISIAVWSAATAVCGVAGGMVQMALGRVFVGIGEAGAMPASQSIVSQFFGPRRRATALGILSTGPYLGLVVGMSGGGVVISLWGWRWAFLILGLVGIPLALLVLLTGPRRGAAAVTSAAAAVPKSTLQSLRACWSIPSLRLLAIGTGVFNIYGYAGSIWFPAFLMRSHAMSAAEAGFWLGVCATVGGVAGATSSGAIVDALSRRDIRWQLRVPALGFALSFPVQLLVLWIPAEAGMMLFGLHVPVIGLLMVVSSFLSSLWMGPSFAAVSRIVSPEYRSQATAMLIVIINVLGSTAGPLVAGFISDGLTDRFAHEALRYSLLSMSVLTLAGGAIFWRASLRYPADVAAARL